ncbi:carbohydrate porin [Aeoliella sp. SH292]|uniref:carbohydrate porin n=1 Tax=Aeoliella sp. SH292 TaxID=3454464 RepID=UPI003F95DCB2
MAIQNLGRAVAAFLLSACPAYASEVPSSSLAIQGPLLNVEEYSAIPSGSSVQLSQLLRLARTDVTTEPNPAATLGVVPGRPNRPEDETAELEPQGDDANEEADEDAEELQTLLGERWHELGPFSAQYLYTGEVFNNTRGGISTKGATRYRGNLDLELRMDTAMANWWDGGEFYVYMEQSQGTTLTSDFVGDSQYYSDLDTSPKPQWLTQLGEYWYGHTVGDDVLVVRVGRYDPNNDFAFADLGGDFINSSFETLPNVPMPFWPFQTLGVTALFQPHEKWRLGGSVNDQGRDVGQWWMSTTNRGMFFIAQADYLPFAGPEDAPLTIIRGGAWGSSSDTEAVDATRVFENNYGFYATIDLKIFTEKKSEDQGLGVFVQYCWAPSDRNQVDQGIGGGLVYTGLLQGREADTCGIGCTQILFSDELEVITGQESEIATEVFYKARLNDWFSLTPDLQYITRPGGIYRDAMVAGFRFEVAF